MSLGGIGEVAYLVSGIGYPGKEVSKARDLPFVTPSIFDTPETSASAPPVFSWNQATPVFSWNPATPVDQWMKPKTNDKETRIEGPVATAPKWNEKEVKKDKETPDWIQGILATTGLIRAGAEVKGKLTESQMVKNQYKLDRLSQRGDRGGSKSKWPEWATYAIIGGVVLVGGYMIFKE